MAVDITWDLATRCLVINVDMDDAQWTKFKVAFPDCFACCCVYVAGREVVV